MRVISGIYKGRKLEGYDILGTRPTMNRVKESMFAMIQNYLKGALVLDLFAGTGSLGIEALSNGASYCYFVDNNKVAIDMICKNTKNMTNLSVIKNDSLIFIKESKLKFDVIFLDPPYNVGLTNIINIIEGKDLLNDKGIIVCEVEQNFETNLNVIKEKQYKNKKVIVLQKI